MMLECNKYFQLTLEKRIDVASKTILQTEVQPLTKQGKIIRVKSFSKDRNFSTARTRNNSKKS